MQRLSRRDFLRLSALTTGSAILAACVPPTAPPAALPAAPAEKPAPAVPAVSAELPVPREEAVIINETAIFTVFGTWNPFPPNALGYGAWQAAIEHLFYINWATGEFINWLAEGYEYNDDFTQMTVKTRPEAQWNDGTPFTTADIEFTVNMVKSNTALWYGATMAQWVDNVETPDPHTIVFHLTKPNPRFHMNFAQAWGFPVMAKHVWEGQDPLTFKNHPPVFTGPYKLFQELPDRRMVIWERNENYWGKSRGYFPGPKYYIYQTSPPPEAEIADLQNNLIDHAHSYTTDKQLLERSKELNPKVVLAPWRDPCPRGIWFNCAKYPLSRPEVRWAIHHCVNKEKAANVLFPWPTVPARYPWADWDGNKKYEYEDILSEFDISFDPQKGAKILDDLGFKPGPDGIRVDDRGNRMSFTILVPQVAVTGEYPIAQDLAEELRKIGVEATVKWTEMAPFDEATSTGNFDITSHWFCGNWAEPPMTFTDWQAQRIKPIGERATEGNWVRLNDPELTEVVQKMEVMSPDDPAIVELYRQAFRLYMKNMPGIPVVQTTFVMPFNTTYWTGWPEEGNIYAVPFTWWPEFKFVLFNLKKAT
ncbi:MAG: ABC transporter substrate-binding protein [Anaerolineae bacterium]|nr:ABC transporter substrate-binding protein [Anaerolineae bacterium]MDW8097879.1 ABC transporter substrate-binding protein [Anaerolineae bacterium]